MSDINQLEAMFPQGKEITVAGVDLTIKPFKFGQMAKVMKTVEPFRGSVMQAFAPGNDQIAILMSILGECGEAIAQVMSIASGQTTAWAEDLEMDEAMALFISILEVNADFFFRKLLPSLTPQLEKAAQAR